MEVLIHIDDLCPFISLSVIFQTRSLRGRKLFNCDLQQWHWQSAKCLLSFVSIFLFVALLNNNNINNNNNYNIFIRHTDPITKKKQFKARNYKQQQKLYLHKTTHLDWQSHMPRANTNMNSCTHAHMHDTHAHAHIHTHTTHNTQHTHTAVFGEYG